MSLKHVYQAQIKVWPQQSGRAAEEQGGQSLDLCLSVKLYSSAGVYLKVIQTPYRPWTQGYQQEASNWSWERINRGTKSRRGDEEQGELGDSTDSLSKPVTQKAPDSGQLSHCNHSISMFTGVHPDESTPPRAVPPHTCRRRTGELSVLSLKVNKRRFLSELTGHRPLCVTH